MKNYSIIVKRNRIERWRNLHRRRWGHSAGPALGSSPTALVLAELQVLLATLLATHGLGLLCQHHTHADECFLERVPSGRHHEGPHLQSGRGRFPEYRRGDYRAWFIIKGFIKDAGSPVGNTLLLLTWMEHVSFVLAIGCLPWPQR